MPGRARHTIWKLANPHLFPRNSSQGPKIHAAGPHQFTDSKGEERSRAIRPFNARIARIIGKRLRQGGKVKLEKTNGKQLDEQHVERQIETIRRSESTATTVEAMRRMSDRILIYKTCIELARAMDGKKPNVYQVVAALAFERELGGISNDAFHRVVRQMGSHYTNTAAAERKELPWSGEPRNIIPTLYTGNGPVNLPARIWALVEQAKGHMLSAREIVTQMGLPPTRKSFDEVNASLQLLDVMGVVHKQPTNVGERKRSEEVWSAASHHAVKRNINNAYLSAIERMHELSPTNEFVPVPQILRGGAHDNNYTRKVINILARKGIIQLEKRRTSRGLQLVARFTEEGKKIADSWNGVGHGQPLDKSEFRELKRIIMNGDSE